MAQYAFDLLRRAPIEKTVANVHHLSTASSQALRFLEHSGKIEISDESSLLLGSAGGIAKAAKSFERSPFYILNADTVCDIHLPDLAKHHLMLKNLFSVRLTMLLFKRAPGNMPYLEILVDERRSLVRGLGEKRVGKTLYAGIAILEPECLNGIDVNIPGEFLPLILEPAIRTGRAGAYLVENSLELEPTRWFDIGSPELWHQAHIDWMHLYETDELPSLWKERILKANRRIGPLVWTSKRAPEEMDTSQWSGPCYWAPDGSETTPPARLSPRTILYGRSPFPDTIEPSPSGIGYRGLWKTL